MNRAADTGTEVATAHCHWEDIVDCVSASTVKRFVFITWLQTRWIDQTRWSLTGIPIKIDVKGSSLKKRPVCASCYATFLLADTQVVDILDLAHAKPVLRKREMPTARHPYFPSKREWCAHAENLAISPRRAFQNPPPLHFPFS